MRKKCIIFILCGLSVWVTSSFSAWNNLLNVQSDSSVQQSDSLIIIDRLNDKTILIRFGYDAVIAISTQKGIVVADAGISTALTAKYRKIIEKEFQRSDVAYLINTHGHPDHTGGNSIFKDAVIIGHDNCLTEISDQSRDQEKLKSSLLKIVNDYDKALRSLVPGTKEWENVFCQKTRYQYAYFDALNDGPFTIPNVTFDDSLDIDMGNIKLNLIYFGKAHSESDILVHIPEEKILMVGDLFSQYGRPGIRKENKQFAERWLKVIEWIEKRWAEIDLVIDGHGQIMSKDDLQSFILYIKRIQ
jgi:cyclase